MWLFIVLLNFVKILFVTDKNLYSADFSEQRRYNYMISAIGNSYSDKNINPVSFQAKLITEIPIKDAKKLLNVQKIF